MEINAQEIRVESGKRHISGLGGWLMLVQIGLYLTIVLSLRQLVTYNFDILASEYWTLLTSRDSEFYHPLWGPVIIFETIYNISLIAYVVFILVHFYRRKRIVPALMIIFYAGSMLAGMLDFILLQMIPLAREAEDGSSNRDIFRSIVTCLIWIPYFLRSARVRNTFVN